MSAASNVLPWHDFRRLFFSECLERPTSSELVACLSTERRRAYFLANASPTDEIEIRVAAALLPPGRFERVATPRYCCSRSTATGAPTRC